METDADNQAHEWSAGISLMKEGDVYRIDRMALNSQESALKPAKNTRPGARRLFRRRVRR